MQVYHFSNIGQRTYQEDNYYVSPDNKLFIICDGVGGQNNGSIASKVVVDKLVKKYNKFNNTLDEKKIHHMIGKAKKALVKKAEEDSSMLGMGTTIALLYLDNNSAIVAHAGDSRVYYKSSITKYWVTKDHSVVQELFDAGVIQSSKEMMNHPMRNRITNALIARNEENEFRVSISTILNVEKNSYFLMCSDGALENYSSKALIEHFNNSKITFENRWKIFENHCLNHSQDNNTCILIHL